jgi:signal transduction histidine kinase
VTRWPLSRIVGAAIGVLLLFSVALVAVGAVLNAVFAAMGIGLAVIVVALALGLCATAIRPLHRLAEQARQVAEGDFGREVTVRGPREVADLAADVNTMREHILHELSATRDANTVLQARAEELQRSNAELEQFAYIASHDLQEPLRKVASFTQLLQRRYAGQLDARADQYIEFAVDGAKRMQALINDLLAYSRVGRSAREPSLVSSEDALAQARANLAASIEETGAAAHRGVPEPAQQLAEVQRRKAAARGHHGQPRRALLALLVQRQWHRNRPGLCRPHFRDFPAAARADRLSRNRHRPGHDPEDN